MQRPVTGRGHSIGGADSVPSPSDETDRRLCLDMEPTYKRRPGDRILDRYTPDLTGADRELAHDRLGRLVKLLIKIARRKVDEDMHISDSRESDSEGRIQPSP